MKKYIYRAGFVNVGSVKSRRASHSEGPPYLVTRSAVAILKVLLLFEQRIPCCHFTLDPAGYVTGSEYTTVFLPLTPEKHINSSLWNIYTA